MSVLLSWQGGLGDCWFGRPTDRPCEARDCTRQAGYTCDAHDEAGRCGLEVCTEHSVEVIVGGLGGHLCSGHASHQRA